jgi:hypothetical protein
MSSATSILPGATDDAFDKPGVNATVTSTPVSPAPLAAAPSGPEAVCEICFRPACTRDHRECSPPRKMPPSEPRPRSHLTCQRCGQQLRDQAPLYGFCILELALEIDPAALGIALAERSVLASARRDRGDCE